MKDALQAEDFEYDLELSRAADAIRDADAKLVCVQLPDGMKPLAGRIATQLEDKTGASVVIWLGSCYGACDLPPVEPLGVDLLIAWGHSEWRP